MAICTIYECPLRRCGDTHFDRNVRWRATHTPFVTTNYMPRVDESDHGTWRRLAMVEFPYRYRKTPTRPSRGTTTCAATTG